LEAVQSAVKNIREQIAETKKKAKAAVADAEVEALLTEMKEQYRTIHRLQKRKAELFLCREIWGYTLLPAMWLVEPERFGLKSKRGLINRLKAERDSMARVLEANKQYPPRPRTGGRGYARGGSHESKW
jgi:hypothetical protein